MTYCRHFIKTFDVVASIFFKALGGIHHSDHAPFEVLHHEGPNHHNFASEISTLDKPFVGRSAGFPFDGT